MTNNFETPEVSIIIPVYNEEAVLSLLFERLYPVLENLKHRYEVIFVDDGSRDQSAALLRKQFQLYPDTTRVVFLRANAGQHAALIAGFDVPEGTMSLLSMPTCKIPRKKSPICCCKWMPVTIMSALSGGSAGIVAGGIGRHWR